MIRIGKMTRRKFLRAGTAAGLFTAAPLFVPRHVLGLAGTAGANERIVLGIVGMGVRGDQLVLNVPASGRVAAICDADARKTAAATAKHKADWKIYQDYRKLIERKDLDAVIVAACDHHHVLASILACQAGKDVYCEKPLSLYIREGRALVAAAPQLRPRRADRHAAADDGDEPLCLRVRSRRRHRRHPCRGVRQFRGPDSVPGRWPPGRTNSRRRRLGPVARPGTGASVQSPAVCPLDRQRRRLVGQLARLLQRPTDGPGLAWIRYGPVCDGHGRVGAGRILADRGRADARLRFPLCQRRRGAAELSGRRTAPRAAVGGDLCRRGCKIEINRNKFTTNPPDFVKNPPDPKLAEKWEGDGWVAKGHVENWFDCIRTRAKPNADVEIGHRTASLCQLLVITRQLGRRLKWDPVRETFSDDEEANRLLDRPRRRGWELPSS